MALALGVAGAARANVVTFDGGTLTGPDSSGRSGTYVEDGLEFDFYGLAPTFVDDGHGGHAMRIHQFGFVNIYPVVGGPFSLDSFDFLGGGDTAMSGYHGALEDLSFRLNGLFAVVRPADTDPGWGDITEAVWTNVAGFLPENAIDNVMFDLPARNGAPEPAAWTLMITGFLGLGAAMRRRVTAAA
jgi:hypothetical protein